MTAAPRWQLHWGSGRANMLFSQLTYPDHTVRVSRYYDVLGVPLIHLGHAAADDLLAPPREGVHTHDGVPVDAPHVDVRACTGHNVPLGRQGDSQARHTVF